MACEAQWENTMGTRTIVAAVALAASVTACSAAGDATSANEATSVEDSGTQVAVRNSTSNAKGAAIAVTPVGRLGAVPIRANRTAADLERELSDHDAIEERVTLRSRFRAQASDSGRELEQWTEVTP
jgi:hypothetical protein